MAILVFESFSLSFVGRLMRTVAWCTIPLHLHWSGIGHSIFLQLHCGVSNVLFCKMLLLWLDIILWTFGRQLYEIFTVLQLKIGLRGWPSGNDSSRMRRNSFPMFVFTLMSKGGLNHVTFLFRFYSFFILIYIYIIMLRGLKH